MAIASVNDNRGTTTTTTGGANPTIDLPAGASITVGNALILTAAYDNSGTSGVDPNMNIVSSAVAATQLYGVDLRGNLWFRIAKQVRSSGSANDGAVADIWACLVNTAYVNGDDITLQFDFPVAGLAVRIAEFSGLNVRSYSVVTATTGTGNGTSFTAPAITPTVAGQMVVAVTAVETNTAITGDADTTDGSWVTISNNSANSGVDATSQTLFAQRKIVTGTTAQNWTATKTGAADWAALAVVFAEFTNVANGFVSGNPNYPCIAGAEILPLDFEYLPIDTGTEYLQTHQVYPNSYGTQNYQAASFVSFNPVGGGASYSHHAIIHEVFQSRDSAFAADEVFTEYLPITAAGVGGGASVSSGAAAEALASAGGAYVTLPNAGYVDVLFNPATLTTLFPNYRIVRWGVQYLAWKDDSDPEIGVGIIPEWRDSAANNGAGAAATISAWLVPNYKRDVQYEQRWIGEVNPIIRGKGTILAQNAPYNAAFTVNDLSHMANGDQTARLRIYGAQGVSLASTTCYLDFIRAVVELVPERRLAQGTRLVSNAPTFASAFYDVSLGSTQMWTSLNSNTRWQLPAANNAYVLATREPMPASPADYYANLVSTASGSIGRTIGVNEAIGPSWLMRAIAQPRATLENPTLTGQPELFRGITNGGVLSGQPEELDEFVISVAPLDLIRFALDGSFFPAYQFGGVYGDFSEIYTGGDVATQVVVSGSTQFNRVKVLIYPDELTTANLTITVEKPALTVLATAVLTPAQVLALPDLGGGWREISVPLNVAVTPTAGNATIRLASTTPVTAPWRVSRALGMNSDDRFGYNPTVSASDVAAVLQCTLADPTYVIGSSAQNIYRPTDRCITGTVTVPQITLSNGDLYDWVSIERAIGNGGSATYEAVTLIQNPTNGQVYIDTGAPWGIPTGTIYYRIRGYRNADHLMVESTTPAWVGTIAPPGAAFGLAGGPDNVLYVYVPVDESSLQVQWNPLNPMSIVPLFGVDYQIPLRAPEERGLSTSFLVMVDQLSSCGTQVQADFGNEDLGSGEFALSPTPFDQIREVGNTERLSLILPGGYTQWVTVSLGTLTIKTPVGIYLAEMTLTPVTPPVVDPYEETTVF